MHLINLQVQSQFIDTVKFKNGKRFSIKFFKELI